MASLRDTLINLLEDIVEDDNLTETQKETAEACLEKLEDMRDGYGTHSWDED
jgi:hypothetical protein